MSDTVNAYVNVILYQEIVWLRRQQRAGADQAAAGDQRSVPGRRDHPHRRGAGGGGAGQRDGAAAAGGRQPADSARHLPAGGRLPRRRRWWRRSRCGCRSKTEQEADAGRGEQQSAGGRRAVQRCRGARTRSMSRFGSCCRRSAAGPGASSRTTRLPPHTRITGCQVRGPAHRADVPGRRRIFRGPPGAAVGAAGAADWWTIRAAPSCRSATQAWEQLQSVKGAGRQRSGRRSAPSRSPSRACSARPSSAAAPPSMC